MQKFNNAIYIGTLTNDKKKNLWGQEKHNLEKKTTNFLINNDRFLIVKILLLCYGWLDLQCNIL